ncbi:MAG: hypothetical protein ACK5JT_19145 [Hyphomicrobiaceae bacterium]
MANTTSQSTPAPTSRNGTTEKSAQPVSSGIEKLIQRLKDEGVAEGEATAGRLVSEAQTKASEILAKAEAEARRRTDAATEEAEKLKRGGEEALKIALRDAVLELKEGLAKRFSTQLSGLVAEMSADKDLLARMILAVAGRARDGAGLDNAKELEILLPKSAAGVADLQKAPELMSDSDPLARFVRGSAADILREGVSFSPTGEGKGGITVVVKNQGVQLDLSDKAITALLLSHLQPRFRALLDGAAS